jgi:hypothetical protein
MVSLILLFVALGYASSGKVFGVFISPQNRVSLARIQVTAWTIVLLSAFATYAGFNIGTMGAQWQEVFGPVVPSGDSQTTENASALNNDTLFPRLQEWTWAVLGITIASPLASALIKGQKTNQTDADVKEVRDAEAQHAFRFGALAANASPSSASIADIFFGEDAFNFKRVDISRTQLVIITLILLYTYSGWLIMSMGNITRLQILEAFPNAQPVLASFPEPGAVFVGLLGLTHGAYIFGKFQPGNPPDNGDAQ